MAVSWETYKAQNPAVAQKAVQATPWTTYQQQHPTGAQAPSTQSQFTDIYNVPDFPYIQGGGGWGTAANIGIGAGNVIKNVGVGLGKAMLGTGADLATMGLRGVVGGLNKLTGTNAPLPSGIPSKAFASQGIAQGIGNVIGTTAQFFAPGGAEAGIAEKAAPLISKLPSALQGAATLGTKAGLSGLSMGGVTAAQGGSQGEIIQNSLFGVGGIVAGKVIRTFGKPFLRTLMTADMRLSSANAIKAGVKLEHAADFLTNNEITGTPEKKYNFLSSMTKRLENGITSSLPNAEIDKQVIKDNILGNLATLKNEDEAVYNPAANKVKEAFNLLDGRPGKNIHIKQALNNKRSWGGAAFKASKSSVSSPDVSQEGAYAISKGYYTAIQDMLSAMKANIKVPAGLERFFGNQTEVSLSDYNKVYSDAINARDFMGFSLHREDNPLVGRMLGILTGRIVGQAIVPGPVGEAAGMIAGEALIPRASAFIRSGLEKGIVNAPALIPGAVKTGVGVSQSNQFP